jgi:uncharacterized membrane protein YeaQ/YmgE (transglycosylase-associated protein family)
VALLWWLIVGLIAGSIARAVWSGRDDLSLGQTFLLGILGSFAGGFLFNLIGPGAVFKPRATGLIGSSLGAIVLLGIYRWGRSRE